MTEQNDSLTLERLPANKRIVDFLFEQGFISHAGKEMALEWLYPHQDWAYRVSVITRILGGILILSALVYFFAHNWQNMSTSYKFFVIELALACAVLASLFYNDLNQKLATTAAAILTGILLAFYAQTYQTGASSYVFFALWALFITPWVVFSQFSYLWYGWLIVLNFALGFYLDQVFDLNPHLIRSALLLLNVFFLGLREYGHQKGYVWLQESWHRYLLLLPILFLALMPMEMQIAKQDFTNIELLSSAALGWVTVLSLAFFYVKKDKHIWALSLIVLVLSFALSSLWVRVVVKEVESKAIQLSLCTVGVFCIFTLGTYFLKRASYFRYLKKELAYGHAEHE